MFKKILFLVFLASSTLSFSQSISEFKYVIIPEQFTGFDANQYELNRYLGIQLLKKDYEILSENSDEWPAEVQQNPCLALNAMVQKEKSFLKNKLSLKFTDCSHKVIFEKEGESKIKEFDKGYQDALKQITNSINVQNAPELPVVRTKNENRANPQTDENSTLLTESNIFSDGELTLVKTELKDNSFLLINESNAQVYAQFYPSSKTGIYHVKINKNGETYFTIGFTNQNSIEIEVQNNPNQWTLKSFKQQ